MSSQIKNQYTGVEVGKDERKTHEAGRRVDGTPEANSQARATLSANNPRLGGPRYVICILREVAGKFQTWRSLDEIALRTISTNEHHYL